MTSACVASAGSSGYISSFSGFLDCRAEMLDTGAFSALAAPGSALSQLLATLLAVFVALLGYNLLLGRGPTLRTGTVAAVRVGVVLTLATSWPAYRTLVYDLAVEAPAQIAADVGRAGGVPGSDGTLAQRLDAADGALQQLAIMGPGQPDINQARSLPPEPMANFNAFALGGSRILFLVSALVGVVSVRLVAAMMLALGPYAVTLLLFDATSSLFEGWVRVLAGAATAAFAVSLCLGFELALLEPWLSNVLSRRISGEALPTAPTELFVTISLFACTIIISMLAAKRVPAAFRLRWSKVAASDPATEPATTSRIQAADSSRAPRSADAPSRAALTASVVASMQRREATGSRGHTPEARVASRSYAHLEAGNAPQSVSFAGAPPTGRSFPRRTKMRTTSSTARRDRIA